ncbi:DUF3693 domain-containing protein [Vibrio atlanticus]|uniref:Phage related protein n=1 Tax=Vibrio atlanticus TaxID=693153 RepID=A0A1C3J4T2_9VIBR|nr:DUF3693 domain-containing protein [Vibrio atlanticus]SBS68611.1 Phage related protein [Vibrio atlanticus]
MYQNELIEAYKKAQNYVQDKQIAMDMNIPQQRISDFRKGRRYLTDSQTVFLAENAKLDPQVALLGCHADRSDNPQIKQMWEHMAKKFNGLNMSGVSMACGSLALLATTPVDPTIQCVLCILC